MLPDFLNSHVLSIITTGIFLVSGFYTMFNKLIEFVRTEEATRTMTIKQFITTQR